MKKWKASLGRFFAVSLLAIGLAWIWADRIPALIYFFAGTPVQIEGVLGNRAGTVTGFLPGTFILGPTQVRNMLGQPYFIAFDENLFEKKYEAFTEIKVKGRLVKFGSQYKSIRQFFEKRLAMNLPADAQLLIVGEEPFKLWRYPLLFILSLLVLFMSVWMNRPKA
ncbi:MAG: hypothetical protein V4534_01800 [Myxococcota bacterium]